MLTLVLVQALDLDIKNRLWVNLNPGALLHKRRQPLLVSALDIAVRFAEFSIVGLFLKGDKLVEIVGPLFLQRFIQQRRQRRVALLDPAARRNAVGDVVELVRPQLVIFREQIPDHQIGVQGRHAVHRKAADHAQICHPHLSVVDHRQLRPGCLVAGRVFSTSA